MKCSGEMQHLGKVTFLRVMELGFLLNSVLYCLFIYLEIVLLIYFLLPFPFYYSKSCNGMLADQKILLKVSPFLIIL